MKGSDQLCRYLDWDSQFFNRKIARINTIRLDLDSMEKILKWCQVEAIDCIYYLCDSDDIDSIMIVEDQHFKLVDIRVTLGEKIEPDPLRPVENAEGFIRPFETEDIPALCAMARVNHHDSRFYSDRNFPVEVCDALYETWIEKSCHGYADTVFVAELNGQPIGYISCHLDNQNKGQIGLLGVDSNNQGMGIGYRLIHRALRWFAEKKVVQVSVVTQGKNIKAQRLYQRCGFMTCSVQLWYHGWFTKGHRD